MHSPHIAPSHPLADPHGTTPRVPWAALILLAVAQFMVILDVTVVNVALPSIGDGLHFSGDDLQWVVTAYVLFTGGLMLFGGRMADLIGRRPVLLAGLHILPSTPASWPGARGLDFTGAVALMGGLVALVLSITGASQHGWVSTYTAATAALSAVLIATFARTEMRSARPLVAPATW